MRTLQTMANKLKIGEVSKPRYEFRTFGSDFEEVAQRMSHLSAAVPKKFRKRTSAEIYIVSKTNDTNNVKIRDEKMDIKKLIQAVDGLEQWTPLMKGEFPFMAQIIVEEIFPMFQLVIPKPEKDELSFDDFLSIIKPHPELKVVTVEKERYGYMVNGTICEYALVQINGSMISTVSSESTNIDDVKKTIWDLGLEGMENINYIQAVKRVTGMKNKTIPNNKL